MAPDDIEERVLRVIATTKRLPRESVTVNSSFESLGVDSLDRLNILFDLESEFDIQINDEDAKRVENIPQMVQGVRELVNAKEAHPAPALPVSIARAPAPAQPAVTTESGAGAAAELESKSKTPGSPDTDN